MSLLNNEPACRQAGRKSSRIGISDSGFGGLSILNEIVKLMPEYDYVYLGDTARAPYGDRSQKVIYEFTKEGIDFLFENECNLVILACNTASSEALRKIQMEYLPKHHKGKKVLGVIIPGAEEAVLHTKNKKIGVLATDATVSSGAFKREIEKLDPKIKVFEVAAPLLVPVVEAGEDKSKSAKMIIKQYVDHIIKKGIDTLILGCTHYGILEAEIKKNAKRVKVLSEGKIVARKLKEYFGRHPEFLSTLGKSKKRFFYTTDSKPRFDRLGSRFFGSKISSKTVILKASKARA